MKNIFNFLLITHYTFWKHRLGIEHIKKIKEEKPEMDDFEEEKKNFGSKGKILRKVQYLKKIF